MKNYLFTKIFLSVFIVLFIGNTSISQPFKLRNQSNINIQLNSSLKKDINLTHKSPSTKELELFYELITVMAISGPYIISPVLYSDENNSGSKKLFIGITREFTLGFGKGDNFRISYEPSLIFRGEKRFQNRISAKYDLIIGEGNSFMPYRLAVTIGAGYLNDGRNSFIFPEACFGAKFGNVGNTHLILYPSIKFRYNFITDKTKGNNTLDFSLGGAIGYAFH